MRKICVNEVTSTNITRSQDVTCCPTCSMYNGKIVGIGDECEAFFIGTPTLSPDLSQISFTFLANFEFISQNQFGTISDYCFTVTNETLPIPGIAGTVCCGETPLISSTISCTPAYTFTDKCITGTITKSFTIDNLCIPTVLCVEDTNCP